MKYDGCVVGPRLRSLRKERGLTVDEVCELTGLSVSTLKQLEQGGRRLSLRSLYLLMTAYQCDANTLLGIKEASSRNQKIEEILVGIPERSREKYMQLFMQVIRVMEESQRLGGKSSEKK